METFHLDFPILSKTISIVYERWARRIFSAIYFH